MAEKRLIDAMQTVTKLSGRITPLIQEGANPMRVYQEVLQVIAEAPTVDAVEVVRCKDCRYWEKFQSSLLGEVMCCIAQGEMNVQKDPYDFCSYGERRTD